MTTEIDNNVTERQQDDDEEYGAKATTAATDANANKDKTTTSSSLCSCCRTLLFSYFDRDSLIFSLRVGTALVIGSLFTLVTTVNWPNGVWLYVTLAIVSWQPALDVASCAKKSVERIIGTIMGSVAGLIVGFLSLLLIKVPPQPAWKRQMFLGLVAGIVGYVYPYVAYRFKKTSYPFASATWTFGICFLAFSDTQTAAMDDGTDGPDPWEKGIWRMINITLACVIGTVLPLFVWPVSTQSMIVKKMNVQMKNTGKSAQLVLQAAHELLNVGVSPLLSVEELIVNHEDDVAASHSHSHSQDKHEEHEQQEDQAHAAYMTTMQKWGDIYGMFNRLKYDILFHHCHTKEANTRFVKYRKIQLSRVYRINTTIIMLDSFVRGALHHEFVSPAEENKTAVLEAISDAGRCIECVLDMTRTNSDRAVAAQHLIETDLRIVQNYICQYRQKSMIIGNEQQQQQQQKQADDSPANTSSSSSKRMIQIKEQLGSISALGGEAYTEPDNPENSVAFFQMIYYLILRTVHLHQIVQSEEGCDDLSK